MFSPNTSLFFHKNLFNKKARIIFYFTLDKKIFYTQPRKSGSLVFLYFWVLGEFLESPRSTVGSNLEIHWNKFGILLVYKKRYTLFTSEEILRINLAFRTS